MELKNQGQSNSQTIDINRWIRERIKPDQITRYMDDDQGFIKPDKINKKLSENKNPDHKQVLDIIDKSLAVETLSPDETALLLNVEDPELLYEMRQAAGKIKKKVYDNRIVTFAPLYLGSLCVNNCAYCGFRTDNASRQRGKLNLEQVKQETEVLAGKIGHKRLIVVYGEHPETDVNYIADTIQTIGSVKVPARKGFGQIRRCNVNAAPMSIEELEKLKNVGIGTFQVFQETYHPQTYRKLHPANTIKGDYLWRLYCMHRSMDAGADDVGLGALFGLYDWKFEAMGLLYHSIELEKKFGIGPHTISFPRIEPADNTPLTQQSPHLVNDNEFRKLITVLRLAVPYTGMIITAREGQKMRRESLELGITQTDAASRIGIGAYSKMVEEQQQNPENQQFILGDTRSLDDVVHEFAQLGYITSFCTAGYRCGRTGKCIMNLLRSGREGQFCKLNAITTFREWLDDFGSEETRRAGEKLIEKEIEEVRQKLPAEYPKFMEYYKRTAAGERDLYF